MSEVPLQEVEHDRLAMYESDLIPASIPEEYDFGVS